MSTSGSHEGGIDLYYNENTSEVYAVQLNKDGDMVTQNGGTTVKAYDVFADTVKLTEGEKYTISLDGGVVKLTDSDGKIYTSAKNWNATSNQPVSSSYFDAGRLFGQDDAFVKGMNASESSGEFTDEEAPTEPETTRLLPPSTTTTTTTTTSATDEIEETEDSEKETESTEDEESDDETKETVFTSSTTLIKNTEITAKESRVIADITVRETADGA